MSDIFATNPLVQAWRKFRLRCRLRRAMEAYAAHLFGPDPSKAVLKALAQSSFPLVKARTVESVRIKIAILVLSEGKWDRFQEGLKAAKRDWRDVLLAAGMGFANWQEVIRSKGVVIG